MAHWTKTWRLPALLLCLGIIPLLSVGYHFFTMTQGIVFDIAPADPAEQTYIDNPVPILLHLVPVILFTLLGPFQLTPRARAKWPLLHRVSGRIFVVAGVMAGLSGLYMNEVFPPIGGPAKYWGTLLFGVLMTFSILRGLWAVLNRDIPRHRAWMIRAYAIGIGATTQRLISTLLPQVWATRCFGNARGAEASVAQRPRYCACRSSCGDVWRCADQGGTVSEGNANFGAARAWYIRATASCSGHVLRRRNRRSSAGCDRLCCGAAGHGDDGHENGGLC